MSALRTVLGLAQILTGLEDDLPYGFDGTAALKQRAAAVVFRRNAEEVAEVMKVARARRRPVVCRGSGTGLSGGSVPVPGAIVMGLVRLDRIQEVDA